MAIYKKKSRKTKKTSYRRRTVKFSRKNLYRNKSAKKQATQIYALNKKVNRVVRQIRPETQIIEKPLVIVYFTKTGLSGAYGVDEWNTHFSLFRQKLFNDPNAYSMKGRLLRPYNITIYGQFGNKNYSYPVDVTSGGSTNVVDMITPFTGYLKFIFCRPKIGISELPEQITKSFQENNNDLGLINGPLCPDITNYFRIMFTKTIKVNESNPNRMFRFNLRRLRSFTQAESETTTYFDQGDIYVYIQYYSPMHIKQQIDDESEIVAPIHYLNLFAKYAFVDQD